MKKAELLAPVGKMENAIAAIENGADALFIGGKGFNARAAADNFTEDELEEIVQYATLRGVRVYVTVNILIKETERKALFDYLKYLEAIGVHAIIVQDLGVARMARKYFPSLRLHASTQMSAHSISDVLFLKSLGFKRVVLAREMQLSEIKKITETCDIEIEAFVHGALCYSYSGQCLMSSLIGGRSGNRGRCAQPCRMRYNLNEEGRLLDQSAYLLSLKDICSLEFLPELLAVGVHSLKIEGRMKSPEYVASVVGTYRKYLDKVENEEVYEVAEDDMELIKSIFNRGGFSKGYYYHRGNRKMLTSDSPRHIGIKVGKVTQYNPKTKTATLKIDHDLAPGDGLEIIRKGKESVGTGITKALQKGDTLKCQFDKYVAIGSEVYLTKSHQRMKAMKATYNRPSRKQPIEMKITGEIGQPLALVLRCEDHEVSYKGATLMPAEQNPVTKEKAEKQLTKLGSTSFSCNKVTTIWPENAYLGITDMNEARREAVSLLEQALLTKKIDEVSTVYPNEVAPQGEGEGYVAHVTSFEQLDEVLSFPEITAVYWEWLYDDAKAEEALVRCQDKRVKCYLALPSIMKEAYYEKYMDRLKAWENTALAGFVVRNMGQFYQLRPLGKEMITDYNLNVANSESVSLWQEQGASRITVSVEPTWQELSGLAGNKEKIIYGYIPVMTSSQCVLRGTPSCQKGKKEKSYVTLEDRKQMNWRVHTDCEACVMQILSYEPLALRKSELKESYTWRFQFTSETKQQVREVLSSYLRPGFEMASGISFKSVL